MSEESGIWYLEEVDLYEVFCPHRSKKIGEEHALKKYQKDEFIYFTNEPSSHIYLIANGRVKIGSYSDKGKEIIKTILSQGEIFGELALAGEEKRSDFAQVLDPDTMICPLTIEDMEDLMKNNKPLSLKIFKLMGLRLRKLERRLESLVFKDARTRIVEFLKEMAQERGRKVGFEIEIKNHLTHQDMANLTGTSRQTVTTILNDLKDKNLIHFNRRHILIRDIDQLK